MKIRIVASITIPAILMVFMLTHAQEGVSDTGKVSSEMDIPKEIQTINKLVQKDQSQIETLQGLDKIANQVAAAEATFPQIVKNINALIKKIVEQSLSSGEEKFLYTQGAVDACYCADMLTDWKKTDHVSYTTMMLGKLYTYYNEKLSLQKAYIPALGDMQLHESFAELARNQTALITQDYQNMTEVIAQAIRNAGDLFSRFEQSVVPMKSRGRIAQVVRKYNPYALFYEGAKGVTRASRDILSRQRRVVPSETSSQPEPSRGSYFPKIFRRREG